MLHYSVYVDVHQWSFVYLRRTCYRPMMTILASRERFCLHPDIATAPNKTEACEGATMVGHMDCSYLENAEASWYPQVPAACKAMQSNFQVLV